MSAPVTGYKVTETTKRRDGEHVYEYPQRFRVEARARDFIKTLRGVRPSSKYDVVEVLGRDREAEDAAIVESLAAKVERVRYGLYRVPSTSEDGVVHTVYSDPRGGLHCSCIAGVNGNICRHLRAVKRRRELETARVLESTPRSESDDAAIADGIAAEIVDGTRALRARPDAPRSTGRGAYEVVGGRMRAKLL